MNTISVVFLANFREVTGIKQLELEMPTDAIVGDVKQKLLKLYPRLRTHFANMSTVVNKHTVILDADPLPENAELMLMPPLGGG
jgi:molybdopterin converting factor small subunit